MVLVISIYLLGVVFSVIDLAERIYKKIDGLHSFSFCITYTLFRADTWRFTLKSWYYLYQSWKE